MPRIPRRVHKRMLKEQYETEEQYQRRLAQLEGDGDGEEDGDGGDAKREEEEEAK